MIYLGGLRHVKNTIILGLRAFFTNPLNYRNLLPPQLPDDAFQYMNIYDGHPQEIGTFPLIVISGSSGQMIGPSISNNFASEIYDRNGSVKGYLYGGMYNFNIEVEVGTKTTLEREVLMDITTAAFRFSLRRRMEYHGVIIKDVNYGGESKIQYDSDYIYTSNISISIYSEWYDYYNLLPIEEITINQKTGNSIQLTAASKSTYFPRKIDNNVNTHIYESNK